MNYKEAMAYIEELGSYGIVPGLRNITELCRRLGNPQDALRFVHVAGTNGKGSTIAFMASILECAGYRVGRYTSPAVFEYRERYAVNGRMITQKAFGELLEQVKEACDAMTAEGMPHPTTFEAETALAFLYFKEKACDVVVLETGMGGAMDATNLIKTTDAAVLVSVSMDHMQYLGKTLTEIAGQKAGIIKPGCAVVCAPQKDEVYEVLVKAAEEKACSLYRVDTGMLTCMKNRIRKQSFNYKKYKKLEITMAGKYQADNALTAIEAAEALKDRGYHISEEAVRKGLLQAKWPGRFMVIQDKPMMIMDGAHNEDAAKRLAETIEFYFTNKRIIYIMGILKDKEFEKIIALTHHLADQIITVTPPGPRGMRAYDLAGEVAKVHPQVTAADSLEEAAEISGLLAGKDDVIIAFGSLSYLGRLMEIVEKQKQKGRK